MKNMSVLVAIMYSWLTTTLPDTSMKTIFKVLTVATAASTYVVKMKRLESIIRCAQLHVMVTLTATVNCEP